MDAATLERINLLPRAQAISVGDSVFTEEQRQLIADVYKSLLGKDIRNCSCRHRYSDALEEICLTLKIKKKMRKYQLKAGMVIWLGTECYTNVNLTDEVAKAYLEKFPQAREKEFQAWPDESEEQNEEKLQTAKATLKESKESLALEDVKPLLKEKSVADIIAHQDTLKEAIEGGDIDSIIAAEAGLKDAWEHAEAKPEKPAQAPTPETDDGQGQDPAPTPELTESEGKEPEPEPTPETEKPKTKKGK